MRFLPIFPRKEAPTPMKRIFLFCISFLVLYALAASAGELPTLALEDGANRVALALVNTSNTDLSAVSVSVERADLPAWLSVQCEPRTVHVPKGTQTREKLFLVFTVQNTPAGAEAAVPLTLRDSLGKTWNYTIAVKADAKIPCVDALIGNYPNPFNPTTSITYSLKENARASLVVFNTLGQKVRTLLDGPVSAGKHTVVWDGKDDAGRVASSGVYICRLETGAYRKTIKMLFTR